MAETSPETRWYAAEVATFGDRLAGARLDVALQLVEADNPFAIQRQDAVGHAGAAQQPPQRQQHGHADGMHADHDGGFDDQVGIHGNSSIKRFS